MKDVKYVVAIEGRTVLVTTKEHKHNFSKGIWHTVKELQKKYEGAELYIRIR